jgi:NTE family protein
MRAGFLYCSLLTTVSLAVAQEPSTPVSTRNSLSSRPSLGLVLEGGGALGLAHIGVLKWMEEHRIPVRYISGTSMGGLVGGVYATGYSADETRELIESINWRQVLGGQVPYRDLSFRRKEDAGDYPNQLEFGLRKGVQFPEGFNSGQQVVMILNQVALPYSEMRSFDDLPTPFRCVATDLINNTEHVFDKGSLSLALRSTMSLPGIFSPVRTDGHIFVDGGLMDNLPVDVAKQMGADITIAVHLESKPLEANAPLSALGVLGQSVSVVIAANVLRSMERADVLISVPLTDYSLMQFNRYESIIKAGYQAAESKAALLSKFSVDEATWQQYLAERGARRKTAPVPKFVEVTGASPKVAKPIQQTLANNIGKPVNHTELQNELMRELGNGRFNTLSYQMTNRDGVPGILVQADPKPYAPPTVRPLLLLDGTNLGNVYFSVGARITFLDFGSHRAELRNDVILGSEYGIRTQYFRPLTPTSSWFIAPSAFADNQQYPLYDDDTLIAQFRQRSAGGGMQFGYEFGNVAQLAVGYLAAQRSLRPEVGNSSELPSVSGRYGLTSLQFAFNEFDDPVIPRSGKNADFIGGYVDSSPGAKEGYGISQARVTKFFQLNEPASIFLTGDAGTTYGSIKTGIPPFSLGGNRLFLAYGINELVTDQYYAGRAGYLHQLVKLPPLLGDKIYLAGIFEAGKVFGPYVRSQVPGNLAGGIIINTIFGPVTFGGAFGTAGRRRVFFTLGRTF